MSEVAKFFKKEIVSRTVTVVSCKHDHGFSLWFGGSAPAVWNCRLGCGFFLRFDPEKFPHGVVYHDEPVVPPKAGPVSPPHNS